MRVKFWTVTNLSLHAVHMLWPSHESIGMLARVWRRWVSDAFSRTGISARRGQPRGGCGEGLGMRKDTQPPRGGGAAPAAASAAASPVRAYSVGPGLLILIFRLVGTLQLDLT